MGPKKKESTKKATSKKIVDDTNNDKVNQNNFDILKEKYVKYCKEAHDLQVQLNILDSKREEVLNEIRQLQLKFTPNLNIGMSIDDVVTSNKTIEDVSSNLIKVTSGTSLNKINLKKKAKNSDMETDDSESDNLDDEINCSESDDSG